MKGVSSEKRNAMRWEGGVEIGMGGSGIVLTFDLWQCVQCGYLEMGERWG